MQQLVRIEKVNKIKVNDITGERFGWLLVTGFSHYGKNSSAYWCVICDCGNKLAKRKSGLSNKSSCGCMTKLLSSASHKTHGMSNSPTWNSWSGMHKRCNGVHTIARKRYYERGIKVCKRWNEFKNFLKDMGERPKGKTLDRIHNDRDYKPSNCKWSTVLEQNRNHSKVKLSIELANEIRIKIGEGVIQRKIADEYGVSPQTITDIKQNKIWN